MATWVTHLIIADRVLEQIPTLAKHEFCVGTIAPDCNVENADWSSYTPPREVTHWMTNSRKLVSDCDRFVQEYVLKRLPTALPEESFLWGYYAHLLTDAFYQAFIRNEQRVRATWDRIKAHPILWGQAAGMEETWDSIKRLLSGAERMRDIHAIEKAYLDAHLDSGYLTEILGLDSFPDYIDYLPHNAIPRKIKVMGYLPQDAPGKYPFIGVTTEEYQAFLDDASQKTVEAILRYRQS